MSRQAILSEFKEKEEEEEGRTQRCRNMAEPQNYSRIKKSDTTVMTFVISIIWNLTFVH